MLTDAGNGDDAMVLTRVIVETTVLLQWILRDRIYRLDLYCLSSALFKRHWIELVREYFWAEPDVVAMAERSLSSTDLAVVQAAFGNTKYRWARERKDDGRFEDFNIEKMMKEIAVGDGSSPSSHFIYDVIYHMHSAYAHGTSEGMQQFRTLAHQKIFACELGFNDGQSTLALQGANTYLAWLLQGACNYLGFDDIDREIDEWFERMKTAAKGLADSRAQATA